MCSVIHTLGVAASIGLTAIIFTYILHDTAPYYEKVIQAIQ